MWDIHTGDWIQRLQEMPKESVHCCVTSVPYYGLRNYGVEGQLGLEATPQEWIERLVAGFRELHRVLHPSGTLWLNCGDSYATHPHKNVESSFDPKWNARNRSEGNACNRSGAAGVAPKNLMGMPWRLALALQADGWYWRQWMPWVKRSGMPESSLDRPVTACEVIFLFSKSEKYFYDAQAILVPASGTAHRRGKGVNPKAVNESKRNHESLTNPNAKRTVTQGRQNASFSAAVRELVPRRMRRNHDWFLESWQGMMLNQEGDPLAFVINPKGYSKQMCVSCRRIYSSAEYRQLESAEVEVEGHKRVLAVCSCGKHESWLSHTATFPRNLIEPIILAGTSEHGCCPRCLNPYERILEKAAKAAFSEPGNWETGIGSHNKCLKGKFSNTPRQNGYRKIGEARERLRAETGKHDDYFPQKRTVGWRPTCPCREMSLFPETRQAIPCTVIDVFSGSGTSGVEAVEKGRSYIGIDINPDYNEMARRRVGEAAERKR